MSRVADPRARGSRRPHAVRCDICHLVAEVLDVTDVPRDWAARVDADQRVRHYCPACDRGAWQKP